MEKIKNDFSLFLFDKLRRDKLRNLLQLRSCVCARFSSRVFVIGGEKKIVSRCTLSIVADKSPGRTKSLICKDGLRDHFSLGTVMEILEVVAIEG